MKIDRWRKNALKCKGGHLFWGRMSPVLALFAMTASFTAFGLGRNCFAEYLALRRYSQALRAEFREFERSDHWGYDEVYTHEDSYHYDNYFATVLPEGSFAHLLLNRRQAGQGTHVLELFGSAVFVDLEKASTVTGVRIQEKAIENEPENLEGRRKIVSGNIFSSTTLRSLRKNMRERDILNFDVIVVRPVQGLLSAHAIKAQFADEAAWEKGTLMYLFHQLNRYYSLLNPDGGELFIEEKIWMSELPRFEMWVNSLAQSGCGVRVRRGRSSAANHVLRITRQGVGDACLSPLND